MARRPDFTRLSHREVKAFVSNARLATLEYVSDDRIPAMYYYKTELYKYLSKSSQFTSHELAAVLTSVAWDLLDGGGDGKKKKISSVR